MRVEERSFAAITSPYDIRDFKLVCSPDATYPKSFELAAVTVKDQGRVGSCVAHACSSIVEYHHQRQEGDKVLFSTEFIYGYRPEGYYIGEGMCLRDALKTLQKVGDCPLYKLRGNHSYPEAAKAVSERLDQLKEEAYPHRISAYALVKTENEIKQALMTYGYVLASMPWYKNYKLKQGVYTYSSEETSGNHAVLIYGWNEKGWLVHNSWSSGWGQKGKFIIPFDFNWNETWAILDDIVNGDLIIPTEKWYIRVFGTLINSIVSFFKKIYYCKTKI